MSNEQLSQPGVLAVVLLGGSVTIGILFFLWGISTTIPTYTLALGVALATADVLIRRV